jgi:hypothetical protein
MQNYGWHPVNNHVDRALPFLYELNITEILSRTRFMSRLVYLAVWFISRLGLSRGLVYLWLGLSVGWFICGLVYLAVWFISLGLSRAWFISRFGLSRGLVYLAVWFICGLPGSFLYVPPVLSLVQPISRFHAV